MVSKYNKSVKLSLLVLLLTLAFALSVCVDGVLKMPYRIDGESSEPRAEETSVETMDTLTVHFLDVGQADSALITCGDKTMLIDGGNVGDSSFLFRYLTDRGITKLDYLIATHAHEDHVGGLAGALNAAAAEVVYCPVTTYDSKAFNNFKKYAEESGAEIQVPKAGDGFELGTATVQILACNTFSDTNNTSIVLRIIHGGNSFLFTGDAERETEATILEAGCDLSSTVLKVGHHGSETSTSYPFLREVMPSLAVISVGEGNSYGHPDDATLSRLRDAEVTVYRTDIHGTVIVESNGKELSVSFPDKQ